VATRATPSNVEDNTVVLFLHGGSYAHYSPKDPWYASLTSRLAHSTRRVVVSPAYRLAPANPFPAALDDALQTLRYLRRTSRVVVCGDSAGGGLAMALALTAPMDIVGVVALSGLFDLTASTGSYDKRVDPLFSDAPDEERRSTIRDGLTYLGHTEPRDKDVNSVLTAAWCCYPPKLTKLLRDWRCSPLFAPLDLLKKLPPALLVVGAHEVLLDESLQLGGAIKDCRVVVFEDMWHDFFLYSEGRGCDGKKLEEAQQCIDIVSKFVADTSAAAAAREARAAAPTKESLPQPASPATGDIFMTGVVDSPDKVLSPGREQTPEDVMIARRRAALLPRCYVAYASSSDKRMTASNWTTLLTVSGVFEAERVKVLKADLIFSVLSRDGALGYRAFRQALRQVAVTLYPELGEGDAFRRLVEEDVLPRATLASESEARDAGLLGVS
jgi:monoterpene epsilon-lactone hydrolase